MKLFLSIIFTFILNTSLLGNSKIVEKLFSWETSSGYKLKEFGDNGTQPSYSGEAKNGMPDGMGIMNFPNGSKYIGEWKSGKKHGLGTLTFLKGHRAGEKFVGEFKNSKMWNVKKYGKNRQYIGEYRNGLVWDGIVYENGNIIGRWINGVKQ